MCNPILIFSTIRLLLRSFMKKGLICAVLSVGALFAVAAPVFAQGTTLNMSNYWSATAKWADTRAHGTIYYNVYYKEVGSKGWTHAVTHIPAQKPWTTIGFLRKGVSYVYNVASVLPGGKEYWWAKEMPLK